MRRKKKKRGRKRCGWRLRGLVREDDPRGRKKEEGREKRRGRKLRGDLNEDDSRGERRREQRRDVEWDLEEL